MHMYIVFPLRPFPLQVIRTGLEKGPIEGYEAEAKVQCMVNVHVHIYMCILCEAAKGVLLVEVCPH